MKVMLTLVRTSLATEYQPCNRNPHLTLRLHGIDTLSEAALHLQLLRCSRWANHTIWIDQTQVIKLRQGRVDVTCTKSLSG